MHAGEAVKPCSDRGNVLHRRGKGDGAVEAVHRGMAIEPSDAAQHSQFPPKEIGGVAVAGCRETLFEQT